MRLFVALELPVSVKDGINQEVKKLRPKLPPARWVTPENLHLTLLFLGEVGEDSLGALDSSLRKAMLGAKSFELTLSEPGWFRSGRKPSSLWIGVQPSESLRAVHKRVTTGAAGAGSVLNGRPQGRQFFPHLTLARCKRAWPQQALDRWRTAFPKMEKTTFRVARVVLFCSILSADGPVYSKLQYYPLAKGCK